MRQAQLDNQLAAAGKLPGCKVGGSWRFKREDIDRLIEQQKSENKSSALSAWDMGIGKTK